MFLETFPNPSETPEDEVKVEPRLPALRLAVSLSTFLPSGSGAGSGGGGGGGGGGGAGLGGGEPPPGKIAIIILS